MASLTQLSDGDDTSSTLMFFERRHGLFFHVEGVSACRQRIANGVSALLSVCVNSAGVRKSPLNQLRLYNNHDNTRRARAGEY